MYIFFFYPKIAQGHLSYVELRFMGQAFRMGRYPVHFHLNGIMDQSFVRGCSIHTSFNRAVNVHGSHNLMVCRIVFKIVYTLPRVG